MSSYGYMNYFKPPHAGARVGAGDVKGLAAAAAARDPYGLAPNNRGGPLGIGTGTGFAAPPRTPAPYRGNPYGGASPGVRGGSTETYPNQPAGLVPPQTPPTAAAVNVYDLNTDPALQRIQSLVGYSNEQANASALKQRQNLMLGYGDKSVAESVLGAGDPIAAAAAQNPTSTVAQLGQSRDRNLKTLDDQLNADNLDYSGYRINEEQQAGQDYQNALAQAAGQLNSNLDTVGSNLAAALAANNQQLVSGINSAADRAAQAAIATGTDPGAGIVDPNGPGAQDPAAQAAAAAAGGAAGGDQGQRTSVSPIDRLTQAVIDAGLKRRQGFLNYGLRNSGLL